MWMMPRERPLSAEAQRILPELGIQIKDCVARVGTITDYRVLKECLDRIDRCDHIRRHGRTEVIPLLLRLLIPVDPDRKAIVDRIRALESPKYQNPLVMTNLEEVNGYALYPCVGPIMDEKEYKEYTRFWTEPQEALTLDEFLVLYHGTICYDWGKMDTHGRSFGGFWDYPDGSPEKEHALSLTMDANGRALWKLPFPKRFLIKSIDLGEECVRYANFLAVWMERKMIQMK